MHSTTLFFLSRRRASFHCILFCPFSGSHNSKRTAKDRPCCPATSEAQGEPSRNESRLPDRRGVQKTASRPGMAVGWHPARPRGTKSRSQQESRTDSPGKMALSTRGRCKWSHRWTPVCPSLGSGQKLKPPCKSPPLQMSPWLTLTI